MATPSPCNLCHGSIFLFPIPAMAAPGLFLRFVTSSCHGDDFDHFKTGFRASSSLDQWSLPMGVGRNFAREEVLPFFDLDLKPRACRQALRSLVNSGEGLVHTGDGLSVAELEKIPGFEFSTPEEKGGAIYCAVCLGSFEMGDRCRLLPACNHSFHARCVDCWLVRSTTCPICRSSQVTGWEAVPSSD